MSELTALYQNRKSTSYLSSGQKIVISSKSAHTRPILTLTAWTILYAHPHTLLPGNTTLCAVDELMLCRGLRRWQEQ